MAHNPELGNDPTAVADQQRLLGSEWADVYAAHDEPVTSAEIALRNPSVYLQSVDIYSLPESLQDRWNSLLDTTEKLVALAETKQQEWSAGTSSIEKLQHHMFTGALNPTYREPIAQVIREASSLFADSSVLRHGNTQYYAGNIQGMAGWIQKYTQ